MLDINGRTITLSRGDTLYLTFEVEGYIIQPSDKITFTIKKRLSDESPIVSLAILNVEENSFNVTIDKDKMAQLDPGTYNYDIVCLSGNRRVTFNYPDSLIIRDVVHDV